MAKKKISGISRIDSKATHGWFVRAYRNGKTHSKFFSDLKNKGKGKALNLALAYRDELWAKLGPPSSRDYRIMRRNRGNTTGVIGVCKANRKFPNGTVRPYYVVSWRPEPNLAKTKTFPIATLGDKKAFELACKHRRKMEIEIRKKAKALRSKQPN